jgi:hypothetical protein
VFVFNAVYRHVRERVTFAFEDLGEQQVKNIARPVRIYRVPTALTHPEAYASVFSPPASVGEGTDRQRREASESSSPPF